METKISIIIPIVRPEGAERCIAAIHLNAGIPKNQYEVITLNDKNGIGCPKMVAALCEIANSSLICFLGDDTVPKQNFLRNALIAMETLPDQWGVVGLNTKPCNQIAHWLADVRMLRLIPGVKFFSTEYLHCWCDNELKDIAVEHNRWVFAKDAEIDHIHPINKNAGMDKHYVKAYSETTHDFQTYCRRKRSRMEDKYGTRLAIAVPVTDRQVPTSFMFSFLKAVTEYMSVAKVPIDVLFPDHPASIDVVRNALVKKALMNGNTHLLFMDSDQVYKSNNIIQRMLAHKQPAVGARVHRRYPPFDPLMCNGKIGKLTSLENHEIQNDDGTFKNDVPVKFTGTGCILYDMQVFIGMITTEKNFFELTTNKETGKTIGEDIGFCKKLNDRNVPIMVDASIEIGHLSTQEVGWGLHLLFQKMQQNDKR